MRTGCTKISYFGASLNQILQALCLEVLTVFGMVMMCWAEIRTYHLPDMCCTYYPGLSFGKKDFSFSSSACIVNFPFSYN